MIKYGLGKPSEDLESSIYIDLDLDWIYQKINGVWVVTHKNGEEVEF